MKQGSKITLIVGVFLGIFIGIVFYLFQCIRYVFSDVIEQEYTTLDASNYGEWDGHIKFEREEIKSKLSIFPISTESATDVDYYYSCGKWSSSNNFYVICTEMKYSDEEYQKELQRLAEIKCDIYLHADEKNVCNEIQFSEDLFAYPAYIAIYGSNLSYEYALLNQQENEVIYIYFSHITGNEILPKEYLPIETWEGNTQDINSWSNTNIYYAPNSKGSYEYFDGNEGVVM